MGKILITNIQKFSVHDGPGIRTTVFFKGCPLRCLWCHNPETFVPHAQLRFIAPKCKGCGYCSQICKQGAASAKGIQRDKCILCGECVEACPFGAREMSGQVREISDIFAEVLRDKAYYEKTGGGLTVSGGEPLMQPEGAVELLALAKENGINTAIETSLYADKETLIRVAELCDYVMCDLKAFDSELHKKLTGKDNTLIKENMQLLAQMGKRLLVRIPVIPSMNDNDKALKQSAEFIASLGENVEVELLAYHSLGRDKYRSLDMEYPADEVNVPTEEQMEKYRNIFRSINLKIK